MNTNSQKLGMRIRTRRESLGLTQSDLGDAIGVHKSTIMRYESGEIARIKFPLLHEIARKLNVDPDWLTLKTDIMNPYPTIFNDTLGNTENKKAPTVTVYDEDDRVIRLDDETLELLDTLRTQPEMKMLFSVASGATKDDIVRAAKIIEALRDQEESKD